MASFVRRRRNGTRPPGPAPVVAVPQVAARETAQARRWARRMAPAFWLGLLGWFATMFAAAGYPRLATPIGLVATGVNLYAAYAIRRARSVSPDRFPVVYAGSGGRVRGDTAGFVFASICLLIAVSAVWARS